MQILNKCEILNRRLTACWLVMPALFASQFLLAGGRALAFQTHQYTVTTTDDDFDENPGDGICATLNDVCSLRAAVQESNLIPGKNIISVPAGNYLLTQKTELVIEEDVTVTGAGPGTMAPDTKDKDGKIVFGEITGGSVIDWQQRLESSCDRRSRLASVRRHE